MAAPRTRGGSSPAAGRGGSEAGSFAAEHVAVLVVVAGLIAALWSLGVPDRVQAHGEAAVCELFAGPASGCAPVSGPDDPLASPPVDTPLPGAALPPSATPPTAPPPTSTSTVPDVDELPRPNEPTLPTGDLGEVIDELEIDGPDSPRGGYDRSEFPHWKDTNGTGCDTRGDVLDRDFVDHTLDDTGCRPVPGTGTLTSLWDEQVLDDPADVDIDHIVSLSEAWESGASTWTLEERELFANDPANLIAVSASSNRAKGADGPDRWQPTTVEATCFYVDRYVRVRVAYELTVTTSEHDAVTELATAC